MSMPFDGIVTHALTNDLKSLLTGGKINKIHQPTSTEMMISVRNNGKNHALLLSVHPSYARVHLTAEKMKNPAEPPMFCMVMRKHLQSAIIREIEQIGMDRIIAVHFTAMNEIGDKTNKTLYIEIMGRHSNVVLVNEHNGKIIDCIKHIPPFQNRYRSLLPGADYIQPPSQDKLDLREYDATAIVKKLDFNAGKLDQQLTGTIAGISKVVGQEIVHKVQLGSADAYEKQIKTLQDVLGNSDFHPTIYDGKKEHFHVLQLSHLTTHKQFDNVHDMLDAFYRDKATRDRVKQQMKDLIRLITNELNKNKRKLAIHEKTLQKADKKEDFRKKGELLTANLHTVKRGDKEVVVIDYYDPAQAEMTITLDPEKIPSENAQSFFKKYRKLSAAEEMATREISKTKQEITYLDDLLVQIDNARDEDLEDIRTELQDEGYIKRQKQKKKKKAAKPLPEKFTAHDGTTIYVGRNNKQNEYVTHKLAHKNDMWLHTLDIPGSHIIIKSNNPTEETIEQAAVLAAHYSKAQGSAAVPVDYTLVKYVKKPSGAKPGFVTYTDQKTLYVTPTEELVEALRENNKVETNT